MSSVSLPKSGKYFSLAVVGGRVVLSGGPQGSLFPSGMASTASGRSAPVNSKPTATCDSAVVDTSTLHLNDRMTANCADPALYHERAIAVSYWVNSRGSPSGTLIETRIARIDSAAPDGYTLGPVVMRYPQCSDCWAQQIYGDGSLWIYDQVIPAGSRFAQVGQLLRISESTGAVVQRWQMPSIDRPLVAVNADGFWFAPSNESGWPQHTPQSQLIRYRSLYHVWPGARAPVRVLAVGGNGDALWLVASGHSVWLDASHYPRAGVLWRVNRYEREGVAHRRLSREVDRGRRVRRGRPDVRRQRRDRDLLCHGQFPSYRRRDPAHHSALSGRSRRADGRSDSGPRQCDAQLVRVQLPCGRVSGALILLPRPTRRHLQPAQPGLQRALPRDASSVVTEIASQPAAEPEYTQSPGEDAMPLSVQLTPPPRGTIRRALGALFREARLLERRRRRRRALIAVAMCAVVAAVGYITVAVSGGSTAALGGKGAFAGRGPAAAAVVPKDPFSLAVTAGGILYVGDPARHEILKRLPTGRFVVAVGTGVAGDSGDGGPALRAKILTPLSLLATPSGAVDIFQGGDTQRTGSGFAASIRELASDGKITTLVGNCSGPLSSGGAVARAMLDTPSGAIGPNGNLYLAGASACGALTSGPVLELTPAGRLISPAFDGTLKEQSCLPPSGIAFSASGALYAACDSGAGHGKELLIVEPNRSTKAFAGVYPYDDEEGLATAPDGTVIAGDYLSVVQPSPHGVRTIVNLGYGSRHAFLGRVRGIPGSMEPNGVALDKHGNVYLASTSGFGNGTFTGILELHTNGRVQVLWSRPSTS